jgi:hypothetical protein
MQINSFSRLFFVAIYLSTHSMAFTLNTSVLFLVSWVLKDPVLTDVNHALSKRVSCGGVHKLLAHRYTICGHLCLSWGSLSTSSLFCRRWPTQMECSVRLLCSQPFQKQAQQFNSPDCKSQKAITQLDINDIHGNAITNGRVYISLHAALRYSSSWSLVFRERRHAYVRLSRERW